MLFVKSPETFLALALSLLSIFPSAKTVVTHLERTLGRESACEMGKVYFFHINVVSVQVTLVKVLILFGGQYTHVSLQFDL